MSTAMSSPALPCPKLPLWRTIRLSYSTYFHHFIDALRTSWLWLVVVGALTGFAAWQQFSWFTAMLARARPGMPPTTPPQPNESMLLMDLDYLLVLFASVSIAVTWHRLVILGEQPGFSASNVTSRNVWRYIGVGLALFLLSNLPIVPIIASMIYFIPDPAKAGGAPPPAGFFAMIPVFMLLYCVCAILMLRLSLLLPARAVGDVGLTFKQTWKQTRGNTWRMLWGIAASTLPPLLLLPIGYLLAIGFPNPLKIGGEDFAAQMTANSVVYVVYYLLILPIGIGFLSLAYRHFFQAGVEPVESGVPRTQRSA
jgi:hypothetical protein